MNNKRLYRNRTLTDNLNMVFDFVGENWRLWLKLMIYFLMPFSVILGTSFAAFYDSSDISLPGITYVISIALFIVGCAVVTALGILLVKWFENYDGTLDGCDVSSMWHMMPKTSLKCLGIILLSAPLVALAALSIVIPVAGFASIFAVLPVFFLCPIMLLEPKNTLSGLFKRAFSLGYKKWGTLIAISIAMGVVAVLLNNAITFPLGLFMALESILGESASDSVFWSFILDVIRYLMCVAECFMIFVELGLFVLAMTFHYGSVAAEVEDIGLENDIENFADLK